MRSQSRTAESSRVSTPSSRNEGSDQDDTDGEAATGKSTEYLGDDAEDEDQAAEVAVNQLTRKVRRMNLQLTNCDIRKPKTVLAQSEPVNAKNKEWVWNKKQPCPVCKGGEKDDKDQYWVRWIQNSDTGCGHFYHKACYEGWFVGAKLYGGGGMEWPLMEEVKKSGDGTVKMPCGCNLTV